MKKIISLLFILVFFNLIAKEVLTIYSYDSFAGEWGLGGKVVPKFEKKYNCKVKIETVSDTGMLLSRLISEKNEIGVDIVIGFDQTMKMEVEEEDLLFSYKPKAIENVSKNLIFDKNYKMIPFDYGYISFIYDSKEIKNPPKTFGELQTKKWQNSIILIDPRTSSTGKCFFLYSVALSGANGYRHFWRSLKNSILVIPDSWGKAYNSFLAGEAPIVLSYTTSQAYHEIMEKTERYRALDLEEGGFKQIESVGIVKNTDNLELAKKFIEFTLSDDFQNEIPTSQWMYPVSNTAIIPSEFEKIKKPKKDLYRELNKKMIFENYGRWIRNWTKLMIKE